jgi:hypothetical protein
MAEKSILIFGENSKNNDRIMTMFTMIWLSVKIKELEIPRASVREGSIPSLGTSKTLHENEGFLFFVCNYFNG